MSFERAIADAHRSAVAMAAKMRELVFGDEPLTMDAVHDLQTLAGGEAPGSRVGEEVEEAFGLERAATGRERAEREAHVAHPGEAVVPVADTTDLLRQ